MAALPANSSKASYVRSIPEIKDLIDLLLHFEFIYKHFQIYPISPQIFSGQNYFNNGTFQTICQTTSESGSLKM